MYVNTHFFKYTCVCMYICTYVHRHTCSMHAQKLHIHTHSHTLTHIHAAYQYIYAQTHAYAHTLIFKIWKYLSLRHANVTNVQMWVALSTCPPGSSTLKRNAAFLLLYWFGCFTAALLISTFPPGSSTLKRNNTLLSCSFADFIALHLLYWFLHARHDLQR